VVENDGQDPTKLFGRHEMRPGSELLKGGREKQRDQITEEEQVCPSQQKEVT
jgi:hypothetical protein